MFVGHVIDIFRRYFTESSFGQLAIVPHIRNVVAFASVSLAIDWFVGQCYIGTV